MAKLFKTLVVVSLVMLFSTPAFSQLLISQYYEGTSFNKWVEIKNTGVLPVDLTIGGWYLSVWTGANTEAYKSDGTPSATVDLTPLGTLAAGDVVTVSHGTASNPGYATPADLTDSTVMNFDRDDSVVLYAGGPTFATAAIVDAIGFTEAGDEGFNTSWVRTDPGPGWNTVAGSNVTDFLAVWTEFTYGAVDGATAGNEEYLGTSTVPVELQAFTIE